MTEEGTMKKDRKTSAHTCIIHALRASGENWFNADVNPNPGEAFGP